MNPIISISLNICLVIMFICAGYIVVTWIKKKLSTRTEKLITKSKGAFQGFSKYNTLKTNYWSLVKAYRERVIKRLGWDKENG